jgi:hypothetical protein
VGDANAALLRRNLKPVSITPAPAQPAPETGAIQNGAPAPITAEPGPVAAGSPDVADLRRDVQLVRSAIQDLQGSLNRSPIIHSPKTSIFWAVLLALICFIVMWGVLMFAFMSISAMSLARALSAGSAPTTTTATAKPKAPTLAGLDWSPSSTTPAQPANVATPAKPAPPPVAAPEPGKKAQIGHVAVEVVAAFVDRVPLTKLRKPTTSAEPLLSITLSAHNLHATRKLNYETWSERMGLVGSPAILRDDVGNRYRKISFDFGTDVVGANDGDSIYPGKSIVDVLVFEPPVAAAKYLDLELDGANVGQEGKVILRIKTADIKRQP